MLKQWCHHLIMVIDSVQVSPFCTSKECDIEMEVNVFCCCKCDLTCQGTHEYYRHMRTHFCGPPFKCDFNGCSCKFEKVQHLLLHRLNHPITMAPINNVSCSLEEKSFKCSQSSMSAGNTSWLIKVLSFSYFISNHLDLLKIFKPKNGLL